MICRCKSSGFVVCLLLAMLGGWTSAEPIEQADPQGTSHAIALYEALDQQDEASYAVLFFSDPLLTRRSFFCGWVYALQNSQNFSSAESSSVMAFLVRMASDIKTHLEDPVPWQLMTLLNNGNSEGALAQLFVYGTQFYTAGGAPIARDQVLPPSAPVPPTQSPEAPLTDAEIDKYGAVKLHAQSLPEGAMDKIRPFFTKLTRLSLAIAYSDPGLILQEIDTLDAVVQDFRAKMIQASGSVPPEFEKNLQELGRRVELAKADTMAEMGLLSEFDARTAKLLKQETMVANKLSVLMTGYRMASRQQLDDQSRAYLKEAKALWSQRPDEVSPVFRYVLETAEFQQRIADGANPSSQEILRAFKQAWANLDSYKPLESVAGDSAWYFGRWSTGFWVNELAPLGASGISELDKIRIRSADWVQASVGYYGFQSGFAPDDLLFRSNELQSVMILLLSGLDNILRVYEESPGAIQSAGVDLKNSLSDLTEALEALSRFEHEQGLTLNLSEKGFPPFSLAQSEHVVEMQARAQYLAALRISKSKREALATLEASLAMFEKLTLPESYIDYHLKLGKAFNEFGDPQLAISVWEKALKRAEDLGFVRRSVEASSLLAAEYGKQQDWAKASVFAQKANAGLKEEVGVSEAFVTPEQARQTQEMASLEARAHIMSNNPQMALQALSEGHQMNSAAAQLSSNKEAAKATADLGKKKKQVVTLTQSVKALEKMPASATRDEMINKAQKLLAESKSDFLLQSRNIRQKFSKIYTSALRFDPLNLPDIQKVLPADVAVVQYFSTEKELYIFVVTRDQFRLRSVSQGSAALGEMIHGYLKRVQRPLSKDTNLDVASKNLYNVLVTPIESDLANSSTIVFIPSGKLNVLPFAALLDPTGQPLVAKKTLLELAKTTDFMKIAQQESKPIQSVIVFANATLDLPAAEKEGDSILAIFSGSKLFKREQASKANLRQFAGKGDVLHLATHGTWDAQDSLQNHLKLSGNENIAQDEIFRLKLENTSIVTLSACSTALADNEEVGYVASLAEAFWIAGSRTVVASLWEVDDASTGLLMSHFYKRLKAGDGRAEALRNAQLAVRENPRYAHPYFWSGFLLFGDYR